MPAAALLAAQRRSRDQRARPSRCWPGASPRGRARPGRQVLVERRLLPVQRAHASRRLAPIAKQAHGLPHQRADLRLVHGACRAIEADAGARDADRQRRRQLGARATAPAIARPPARRTPAPRAASCWRAGLRRAPACTRLRPRQTAPAPTCGRRDPSPRRPSDSARPGPTGMQIAREIEPGLQAGRGDHRKPPVHLVRVQMPQAQIDGPPSCAATSSTMLRATTSRGARSPAGW